MECPTILLFDTDRVKVYRLFWRRITLEEFDNEPVGVRDAFRATNYEKSI